MVVRTPSHSLSRSRCHSRDSGGSGRSSQSRGESSASRSRKVRLTREQLVPDDRVDGFSGTFSENVSSMDVHVKIFVIDGRRRRRYASARLEPEDTFEEDPGEVVLGCMSDDETTYSPELKILAFPKPSGPRLTKFESRVPSVGCLMPKTGALI